MSARLGAFQPQPRVAAVKQVVGVALTSLIDAELDEAPRFWSDAEPSEDFGNDSVFFVLAVHLVAEMLEALQVGDLTQQRSPLFSSSIAGDACPEPIEGKARPGWRQLGGF